MTAPNRNALWGQVLIEELAAAGVEAVCVAPGSRSTPLTVAAYEHPDLRVYSHLDERSAAFFALGRGRVGEPTALICTSGTAAANFHPAVIEASQARVPLIALTADRPPELRDSGANQTIDQEKLYGDAVRWYRDLPEPAVEARKLRSLRTDAARAVREATGVPAGPVHLNVPFRKPLAPVEADDVPADFAERAPLAAEGRDGPFVQTTPGRPAVEEADLGAVAAAVESVDRGLIVAGPADPPVPDPGPFVELADATGFPVLADPLSGLRYGSHVPDAPVCGGYDGYLPAVDWPAPEVVLRFGASPTSKVLRNFLRDADARQFLVDPAGEWREATFAGTDAVVADPARFARELAEAVGTGDDSPADPTFQETVLETERTYWDLVAQARGNRRFEGDALATVVEDAPDPATVFVSNSTPVRDVDRFGRPREADLTVLGNRGASGIDGVVSTALGAGSAREEPLVLAVGDLAYYHDMNGLLALERCGVDATVVLVNNDGGGIFHMLPIEEFDPPFTEGFRTPHGLDFEPTGDLYDLEFIRVANDAAFREAYRESVGAAGTQVIEVRYDAEDSHREREAIEAEVAERFR